MTAGAADNVAAGDAGAQDSPMLRLLARAVSEAELVEGAEWAARPAMAHEGATTGLLLFRLGTETAALPAKLLRRVAPWARPTPIPHRTTAVVRGLCNIRGELVLCADLHRLLGLSARRETEAPASGADDHRRMVVIGPQDAPWVIEVDGLVGIERTVWSKLHSPPVTVEYSMPAYTAGIAEIRGERVTVLDGERVLAGFQAGLA